MKSTVSFVSNADTAPLPIWIEPWCDELSLLPRSTLAYSLIDQSEPNLNLPPHAEINDESTLVIWASAAGRMAFTIDRVEQDTGSRVNTLPPELFALPIKQFVDLVFGDVPKARPAGLHLLPSVPLSWWRRLFGFSRR